MEILFTTVCAIVIKPVAFGTYDIPVVIIGHWHTHTFTYTATHKVEPRLSVDMSNSSTD